MDCHSNWLHDLIKNKCEMHVIYPGITFIYASDRTRVARGLPSFTENDVPEYFDSQELISLLDGHEEAGAQIILVKYI